MNALKKSVKYEGKTRFDAVTTATRESQFFVLPAKACEAAGVIIILGFSIAGNLFTCCSHPLGFLAASGLRLETGESTNKKISEVYFSSRLKKILTEN
ncbi:MAG: hypothetical protein ACXV8A_00605 [Chthoniobacterales bacterium]